MQNMKHPLTPEAKKLLELALKEYRATVFWNMKPSMTIDGAIAAAQALRKRGDLAAARLAGKLMDRVTNAS